MSVFSYDTNVVTKFLKLGDVVKVFDGPFGTAVVTNVTDDKVTLFRPHAITSDFSYTGGVIPYTGSETWNVFKGDTTEWFVYTRKEVK